MRVKRCHHHAFTVSDMDDSLGFYRDLVGLNVVQDVVRENLPAYDHFLGCDHSNVRVCLLQDDAVSLVIELAEYRNAPGDRRPMENYFAGTSHVSFEVDDIEQRARSLQAPGVRIPSDGPVDIVQDGSLVARVRYALDPDDISVGLLELIP